VVVSNNPVPQGVVVAQTPSQSVAPPVANSKDVAQITVRLPADAKLFVDNSPCPLTSGIRTFNTPKLEQGKKYFYTLKAEAVQNGQTVVQSQRVTMTAGQRVNVDFGNINSSAWTAKQ
jgi:uncharacterized protein (TIGR03000 family)